MRGLLVLLFLLAGAAHAQIMYAPVANGTYQPLAGATVSGKMNVRLDKCPTGPWTYSLDGMVHNWEGGCPFDFGGDDSLFDTATLTEGTHRIDAVSATTKTFTASFTVTRTPVPPVPEPPAAGVDTLKVSWAAVTLNTDGSPATITGYRLEYGQTAALGQSKDVGNVLTYTLTDLTAGTWYAAVRALSATNQSDPTNLVSGVVTNSTPTPVDCVVSEWSAWTVGTWSACTGTRTRTDTRTRSVLTQPNGGAVCPVLTDTQTVTETCVIAKVWKVAPVTSGIRPVYEAVLNAAGNATVRGNTEGSIAVGKPCGPEAYKVSTNSYRDVTETDLTLNSPTYKGRRHTAICTLQ